MSIKKEMKLCRKTALYSASYGANVARWSNTGHRLPARTIKRIRREVLEALEVGGMAVFAQAAKWQRGAPI